MKKVELQYVCEIIAGQSPPSSTYNKEADGLPFFQGKADFGELFPKVRFWCNAPKKIAEPGDILISVRAPVGPSNINNVKSCIGRGLSAIRTQGQVDQKFLLHYFRSIEKKLADKASGSTFSAITQKDLKSIKIPLPPLETQKKIANILDAADTLRQKTKTLIEKYDQLTQSLFLDMFGDPRDNNNEFPIIKLKSLCSEIIDCPHSTPKKVNNPTEFPCIRTSELVKGYIRWDSMQYLDEQQYILRTKRLKPEAGDIVYAREGTFGEAVVLPNTHKFSLGQRTMLFRPNIKKANNIFLWAMIRSGFVYHQAKRKNTGSTVGHVNIKDIKEFDVLEPPLPLQNQFAERVQAIEEQKAKAQASLEKSEELFQSLLQRAFKGEIN